MSVHQSTASSHPSTGLHMNGRKFLDPAERLLQSRGLLRAAVGVKCWEMGEFCHNWGGDASLSTLARKPNLPGKNHSWGKGHTPGAKTRKQSELELP